MARSKKERLKAMRRRVKRCFYKLAMCCGDDVTILTRKHYDWYVGDAGPCQCFECVKVKLCDPSTMLGIIIDGSIKLGGGNSKVFVELSNMNYWNITGTKRDGSCKIDRNATTHADRRIVKVVAAKAIAQLQLMI